MASFRLLVVTTVLAAVLTASQGCYTITTPRQWTAGEVGQVCVVVTDAFAPPGEVVFTVLEIQNRLRYQAQSSQALMPSFRIRVPAGKTELCKTVKVPLLKKERVTLCLSGQVCGVELFRQVEISIVDRVGQTFIQTDKFLYQPGQNVRFRLLTIEGPALQVSTRMYPEVWVRGPSLAGIAQWRNVNNSAGLVHLDFDLADEPEQGRYTIYVRTQDHKTERKNFMVEEYVLPRFEVTLTPPAFIFVIDRSFTFTVCAKYTFGQPVSGSVRLKLKNNLHGRCKEEVEKAVKRIRGCQDIVVRAEEVDMGTCYVRSLSVSATVEEEGTDVTMSTEAQVMVHRTPFTFKSVCADGYMKPNLPFTFKMRAERPDKTPAAGEAVEVCCSRRCTNLTTGADGCFTVSIPHCNSNSVQVKALTCWTNMNAPRHSIFIKRYFSPTNSSVAIHAPEETLKCSPGMAQTHLLSVLFSSLNVSTIDFTVQVVSRGQIYYSRTQRYGPKDVHELIDPYLLGPLPPLPLHYTRGEVRIPIVLPATAAPTVKVLVWYTREDGEVVSDTRELEMEKCLSSSVNLTIEAEEARPGAGATLQLTSPPESLCSVGFVDRSVELLASQADTLTVEKIFRQLGHYRIPPWLDQQKDDNQYCRSKLGRPDRGTENHYSNYVDALRMFDDSGVYVFSDSTLETRPCESRVSFSSRHCGPVPFEAFNKPMMAMDGANQVTREVAPPVLLEASDVMLKEEDEEVERPVDGTRTDFPETWLWELYVIPASGVSSNQVTLPDTITQWVGKAVCVHPQKGVGMSQRTTITTFIPFFVDLTLPPSVKRGEILHVKITVFNYLNESLPVTVMVLKSEQLQVIRSSKQFAAGQRSSCLAAQEKVVHTVKVKPLVLGDVNITVLASVDNKVTNCSTEKNYRDMMTRPIKVEAEGFPKEKTWTKYVCPKEPSAKDEESERWDIRVPKGVVEGSARGWVTVVGDLLALTLENLGHLIRMPYGCGEQNMINFAPNIFIMQYLTASRLLTPQTTEKLLKYMKKGYQQQLRYRHPDGSFSAFGMSDASGSTWLTAFVLKSFAQAQPFIMIDKDDLRKSRNWLLSKQGRDGCFLWVGKVIHKAMKGGIEGKEDPVPLTAYVMIALLEAGEEPTSAAVRGAVRCLASKEEHDVYPMTLKAYALALAQLPAADALLQQILKIIEEKKISKKYFDKGMATALGVESAAYVVLAMMAHDPIGYQVPAMMIVKWITMQRNGQGGFVSTQDTVVALQALAKFSSHTHMESLELMVSVRGKGLQHKFHVNSSNKLLQQMVMLPSIPTVISHAADGEGCVVLQAVLRYNSIRPDPSDAFKMNVLTRTEPDRNCITKCIRVCASYLLPDGESNMAIIEVNVVSGYLPMKDDLKKVVWRSNKAIRKFDVDGNKISFYVDKLTVKEVCVELRLVREVDVEEVKPGTVVVYDYYEPDFQISKSYVLPPASECIPKWEGASKAINIFLDDKRSNRR